MKVNHAESKTLLTIEKVQIAKLLTDDHSHDRIKMYTFIRILPVHECM